MSDPELSASNPRIRDAARLRLRKQRRERGTLLLEGVRLIADAIDAGVAVRELFAASDALRGTSARALAERAGVALTAITAQAARKLSDTQHPQGVFAVVAYTPAHLDALRLPADPLVLVADGISDPGNLGSIIRSAAALGADAVIAAGTACCDPANPKTVRATMGGLFRIPVAEEPDLSATLARLRSAGLQIAAAVARGGLPPWQLDLRRGAALLVGSEAEGLPPSALEAADARVTIPMARGAESLNAAAAAAVLLAEAARQRLQLTG